MLVTGSRSWTDRPAVEQAIRGWHTADPDRWALPVVIVHGAAPGLDTIAADIAADWGLAVEAHLPDWARCGPECLPAHRRQPWQGPSHCPAAGLRRNARMVALGADVCLAWPLGPSRGTRHAMRLAAAADIPVIDCTAVTSSWLAQARPFRAGTASALVRTALLLNVLPNDREWRPAAGRRNVLVEGRRIAAGLAEIANACRGDVRPGLVPAVAGEAGTRRGAV